MVVSEVVTIAPWNPWPLVVPGIVLVVAVMASFVGGPVDGSRWEIRVLPD